MPRRVQELPSLQLEAESIDGVLQLQRHQPFVNYALMGVLNLVGFRQCFRWLVLLCPSKFFDAPELAYDVLVSSEKMSEEES